MNRIQLHDLTFEPYITEDQIKERVSQLGAQLREQFEGEIPVMLGVLKGAVVFVADLIRAFGAPCELAFLQISSYGSALSSSGKIKEVQPLNVQLSGRHVVILEDIVDSGLSAVWLRERMALESPASVTLVTLLSKPAARKVEVEADYTGFVIDPLFLVGYGLDYNQLGRELSSIYVKSEAS